jgi:thiol-disulfide isomerase/thioredoxin
MRSPKKMVAGLILVCAAVTASGCGGSADRPEGATPAPTGFSATLTNAPEFRLQSVSGGELALSDTNGKVRLIDFWATWCAPCVEEIPMLQELHAKYRDQGFEIIAIAEEEAAILAEFVDEHDIAYPNLVGTADVAQSYRVLGLPSAFLVDGEGRIVERWQGPKPAKVLEEKIRGLLGPV